MSTTEKESPRAPETAQESTNNKRKAESIGILISSSLPPTKRQRTEEEPVDKTALLEEKLSKPLSALIEEEKESKKKSKKPWQGRGQKKQQKGQKKQNAPEKGQRNTQTRGRGQRRGNKRIAKA